MRNDILLTDDDIVISNGDFVIADSNQQHVEHIVDAHPGEFKNHPLLGFAALLRLKKNPNPFLFKRDLKIQLEYDGYQSANIDLSKGFENLEIKI